MEEEKKITETDTLSEVEKENLKAEHTEELPIVDEVAWHRETKEDPLSASPVEDNETEAEAEEIYEEEAEEVREVKFTPIEADGPLEEKKEDREAEVKEEAPLVIGDDRRKEEETAAPEPVKKPKKKKTFAIIMSAILLACLCGGIATYMWYTKREAEMKASYQKVYDQLKVTFIEEPLFEDKSDPFTFEYGSTVNASDLVENHYGEMSIDPATIDTTKIGETEIIYSLAMTDSFEQTVTREFKQTVRVEDTKLPEITLNEESITITEGDAFDAAANIAGVSDPVDGDLAYVEEAPEKNSEAPYYAEGFYTITSDVDTATAGSYTVTVKATDVNGNETEQSYSVRVKKASPSYYRVVSSDGYITFMNSVNKNNSGTGGAQGDWDRISETVGTQIYTSEAFDDLTTMKTNGEAYIKKNFKELIDKNGSSSQSLLGLSTGAVIIYYCAALDEETNIMYYFYTIA